MTPPSDDTSMSRERLADHLWTLQLLQEEGWAIQEVLRPEGDLPSVVLWRHVNTLPQYQVLFGDGTLVKATRRWSQGLLRAGGVAWVRGAWVDEDELTEQRHPSLTVAERNNGMH